MGRLVVGLGALHLLVLLLLFSLVLGQGWWSLPDSQQLNLWIDCVQNGTRGWSCRSLEGGAWLPWLRLLLLVALFCSCGSFGLFLWQLRAGPRGLFLPAGGAQLLAGLLALGGAGLAWLSGAPPAPPGARVGPLPGLALLGGLLALLSGGGYARLRLRDPPAT